MIMEGNTEDGDVEARAGLRDGDADALTVSGFSSASSEDSLAGSSSLVLENLRFLMSLLVPVLPSAFPLLRSPILRAEEG